MTMNGSVILRAMVKILKPYKVIHKSTFLLVCALKHSSPFLSGQDRENSKESKMRTTSHSIRASLTRWVESLVLKRNPSAEVVQSKEWLKLLGWWNLGLKKKRDKKCSKSWRSSRRTMKRCSLTQWDSLRKSTNKEKQSVMQTSSQLSSAPSLSTLSNYNSKKVRIIRQKSGASWTLTNIKLRANPNSGIFNSARHLTSSANVIISNLRRVRVSGTNSSWSLSSSLTSRIHRLTRNLPKPKHNKNPYLTGSCKTV